MHYIFPNYGGKVEKETIISSNCCKGMGAMSASKTIITVTLCATPLMHHFGVQLTSWMGSPKHKIKQSPPPPPPPPPFPLNPFISPNWSTFNQLVLRYLQKPTHCCGQKGPEWCRMLHFFACLQHCASLQGPTV